MHVHGARGAREHNTALKQIQLWVSNGDRTRDNWNHNPALYQLSYTHQVPSATPQRESYYTDQSSDRNLVDRLCPCAGSESSSAALSVTLTLTLVGELGAPDAGRRRSWYDANTVWRGERPYDLHHFEWFRHPSGDPTRRKLW